MTRTEKKLVVGALHHALNTLNMYRPDDFLDEEGEKGYDQTIQLVETILKGLET